MNAGSDEDLREQAMKRLRAQRKLVADVAAYVLVNAVLVVVWALTDRGYFWPAWVLGIWGFFLLLDALKVWTPLFTRPITDADVAREVERMRTRPGGGATPVR